MGPLHRWVANRRVGKVSGLFDNPAVVVILEPHLALLVTSGQHAVAPVISMRPEDFVALVVLETEVVEGTQSSSSSICPNLDRK